MTLASVAFVGLESASGLSSEISVGRRGLKRVCSSAALTTLVLYVGMSLVALSSLPQVGNATSLSRNFLEDADHRRGRDARPELARRRR